MIVRFQADADLNFLIVRKLLRREPGVDFQSAVQADLAGLSDLEVLALAAQEGRLLISHDETTMLRHFAEFINSRESTGLLIVSQALSHSVVVEELHLTRLPDPAAMPSPMSRDPYMARGRCYDNDFFSRRRRRFTHHDLLSPEDNFTWTCSHDATSYR